MKKVGGAETSRDSQTEGNDKTKVYVGFNARQQTILTPQCSLTYIMHTITLWDSTMTIPIS